MYISIGTALLGFWVWVFLDAYLATKSEQRHNGDR
jgi:hypothetical protein